MSDEGDDMLSKLGNRSCLLGFVFFTFALSKLPFVHHCRRLPWLVLIGQNTKWGGGLKKRVSPHFALTKGRRYINGQMGAIVFERGQRTEQQS